MTTPDDDQNGEITQLLGLWAAGDETAYHRLVDLIYPKLRAIASARLRAEWRSELQTTELAHEAFLKLSEKDKIDWKDRRHFFAVASTAIRRLLVDQARERHSAKRGGGTVTVSLDDSIQIADPSSNDWIALDECLNALHRIDPAAARLVEQRFFAGLSIEEAAENLRVGRTTAVRKWRLAKAFLKTHWAPNAE